MINREGNIKKKIALKFLRIFLFVNSTWPIPDWSATWSRSFPRFVVSVHTALCAGAGAVVDNAITRSKTNDTTVDSALNKCDACTNIAQLLSKKNPSKLATITILVQCTYIFSNVIFFLNCIPIFTTATQPPPAHVKCKEAMPTMRVHFSRQTRNQQNKRMINQNKIYLIVTQRVFYKVLK